MRPQVGQVITNKYRLLRLIGDGGMGSVFEARHEVLGTTVALKFLHPELSRRSGLVQRFLQEARVSAQIQSPHVVRVTDVDSNANGQAFIVMEYLEGKTLQTLYEELYHARQRLSYPDALEYAMQMLEGVEAAHTAGVVHRDLKPDNVIITRGKKGEPLLKLLDFGIAKLKVTGQLDRGLTRPGIIMGTPEYMAPEQAYSADAVDARADIFSLGVMTFEMLAGRRPVGGDEPHQIATAYLTRNIAKLLDLAPHIPAELAAAIHRAMGPKPEDRFSSLAEFRSAIEPFWLATRPAATPSPPGASLTPAPASPAVGAAIESGRRVPKTLPPEDEAPAAPAAAAAAAALAPSGGQSIEVVFSSSKPAPAQQGSSAPQQGSSAPQQGSSAPQADASAMSLSPATTPVSRAPEFDQVGATPQPADGAPISIEDRGDKPLNGQSAFARTDAAAPIALPGTVESPPLNANAAQVNGQSTVSSPPFAMDGGKGATADMPPIPERAGGTAVGGAPIFGGRDGSGTELAPPYLAHAGLPATASMDPMGYATPPPQRRAQRSTGASLAMILVAAAAVSGLVVGGIYFAQQRAKEQDKGDDPPVTTAAPPPASVSSEPTIPNVPVKVPTAQPPVVTAKPTGPKPTNTGPVPSGQPTTMPTTFPTAIPTSLPTGFPTSIPTSLIPIPLPTVLPFPFPGQQQQPLPQPTTPTPQPSSTSSGGRGTKPQIIIKFPKTNGD